MLAFVVTGPAGVPPAGQDEGTGQESQLGGEADPPPACPLPGVVVECLLDLGSVLGEVLEVVRGDRLGGELKKPL